MAAKWALPVMIPCLLILSTIRAARRLGIGVKGEHSMEKKQRRAFSTIMALTADVAEIISGNIAGGALLANVFNI